jgi:hypothetical protein
VEAVGVEFDGTVDRNERSLDGDFGIFEFLGFGCPEILVDFHIDSALNLKQQVFLDGLGRQGGEDEGRELVAGGGFKGLANLREGHFVDGLGGGAELGVELEHKGDKVAHFSRVLVLDAFVLSLGDAAVDLLAIFPLEGRVHLQQFID